MGGYHGRYLRIDVTAGAAEWCPLPEDVLRRFIGGVGLGVWLAHREGAATLEPLAPAAPLIFAFSPLVGTPLTTSAKFAVVAKSPLTERFNDALSSSRFALAGKGTGADAIVIVGRCSRPAVVVIDDGNVRFEEASDLWGLEIPATTAKLRDRFGPEYSCAVIGPAGERLVRFAGLSHDGRLAGRGGLGAVLGSKNVKAIAVRGRRRAELADAAGVVAKAKDLSARSFGPATAKYRELGTVSNLLTLNRLNALPTRNFQTGSFAEAEAISGEALNAANRVARQSCAACTIGCEHIYQAPGGTVRLEYESLFALGSLCGIGDRDAILEAARRCDALGLDTISTGATIAFAMECTQRGLLAGPAFGSADGLLSLIDAIAHRAGLGDLLAEGSRRAAAKIGGAAPSFAPHVKGLELPGYEPRTMQALALGLAVGTRGADHNRSGAYEADLKPGADRRHGSAATAATVIDTEDRAALIDSLILCKFLRGVFTDYWGETAELLALVTGWPVDAAELRTTARRIIMAKRLFNERAGWTAAEDTLPDRFLEEPLPDGLSAGGRLTRPQLTGMIERYYAERGCDAEGRVTAATITELGHDE